MGKCGTATRGREGVGRAGGAGDEGDREGRWGKATAIVTFALCMPRSTCLRAMRRRSRGPLTHLTLLQADFS